MEIGINMKTLYVFILVMGSLFISNSAFALQAKVVSCFDYCNHESEALKSMDKWGSQGYSFVVDYKQRTLQKYAVYITYIQEGGESWPVQEAKKQTMSSTEISALPKLLAIYDDMKSHIASASIPSAMARSSINVGDVSLTSAVTWGNSLQFMSTSSDRNILYDHLFDTNFDIRLTANLNNIADNLSIGTITLENLDLTITLNFFDGSHVEVIPDLVKGTLDIVPGTGVDANNNSIPLSAYEATGLYTFPGHDSEDWSRYLKRWGGNFSWASVRYCPSVELACTFSGNTLTCSLLTPPCRL